MESILINTEGKRRNMKIETFDQARQIVCNFDTNATLQLIVLSDGTAMLMDESGKLKNYAFNEVASKIAHDGSGIYPSDYIVGDVLLVDLDEFDALPYE
jgi:hypothetical protein